jgi:Domain of unknown function (DUF397)
VTDSVKNAGNVKANSAQAMWRTSSYSGAAQDCVEVADNLPGSVGVRDSKNPGRAVLSFTPRAWRAFIAEVKNGEFDQRS